MIRQTINCDICGKEKGEVNHWFSSTVTTDAPPRIVLFPWGPKDGGYALCGIACAHTLLSRYFDHKL